MGQIGAAEGGEWHLLRYLGQHRGLLDRKIGEMFQAKSIRWLDCGFGSSPEEPDAAIAGADFLPDNSAARQTWRSIWPSNGYQVRWDAVAELTTARGQEWLLIDSKAYLAELQSHCPAKNWKNGLSSITDALGRAQITVTAPLAADWLRGYFQFAGRLSALNHLLSHKERAHLLLIYFCGDRDDVRRKCPRTPGEWGEAVAARDRHLGLPAKHRLSGNIRSLFLDVCSR
jgi:hypothetical protein